MPVLYTICAARGRIEMSAWYYRTRLCDDRVLGLFYAGIIPATDCMSDCRITEYGNSHTATAPQCLNFHIAGALSLCLSLRSTAK